MFARRLQVESVNADEEARLCPIAWINNFAMRNFTNDAVFDDTLPVADGVLEVWLSRAARSPASGDGRLVPAQRLSQT